jgi:PAS domain S-box-containing protein
MAQKPTYEELAKRVEELEAELSKREGLESKVQTSNEELTSIFDSIDEPVNVVDPENYEILYVNSAVKAQFGENIVGKKCHKVFQNLEAPCDFCTNPLIFGKNTGKTHIWEFQNKVDKRWYRCIDRAITWPDGRTVRYEMAIDIHERKQVEDALREREKELESQAANLEEMNAALKVLLKRRDEDEKVLQEKVLFNVRELIEPCLEKLKHGELNNKQKAYLDILESNLNDIVSPFSRSLQLRHYNLTPSEMQIAALVRDGKTTKQIANLLNLSTRTVDTHRLRIRTKLGIRNKKSNLRSHLLSLR